MGIFEEIWNKVSEDDGSGTRMISYGSREDLLFIYASGFVDAENNTFDQWASAFNDSAQKDGSYRVSFDQWMAKEKFYYKGPIRVPFDPKQIPEKEYSEAELKDMLKQCMVPSSQTTVEKIPSWLSDWTQRGFLKDGKMMMTPEIKKELSDFITYYPSPLRVLEVNVQQILRGDQAASTQGGDKTGYKMGKSTVRTTQAHLDALLSGGQATQQQSQSPDDLSVKDLQKQVKKRPV